MWLLSTDRAELHYFQNPEDVSGGYAILSHVWQVDEQSFQDLQALAKSSTSPNDVPRLRVSEKIRRCCAIAEAHGYKWVWIDTCCIDKTSSAELSEAINSMYAWYAEAAVCYAYLHDVPSCHNGDCSGVAHDFRKSRWFTRGWTLQELIAPRCMIFLSQDWKPLGTKALWSALLEEITGIDADILTFGRELGDVSVARRMSWASRRQTTRVEDEAYSLMAIFDVHMPTIYGEGRQAFRRLQEEIMKQSSDQSLFAWGHITSMANHRLFNSESKAWKPDIDSSDSYLLAPSPAAFANSGNIIPVSMKTAARAALSVFQRTSGKRVHLTRAVREAATAGTTSMSAHPAFALKAPEFAVTSHGVRLRLFVVKPPNGFELTIAVLACQDKSDGSCITLLLLPSPGHAETGLPQFHIAIVKAEKVLMHSDHQSYRLLRMGSDARALTIGDKHLSLSLLWKNVYVAHRYSPRRLRKDPGHSIIVHFPQWLVLGLRERGFVPNRHHVEKTGWDEEVVASWSKLSTRGAKHGPVVFSNHNTQEAFKIEFDQRQDKLCASVAIATPPDAAGLQGDPDTFSFASDTLQEGGACETVYPVTGALDPECAQFLVDDWPARSKAFGDTERTVRVSFSRWPHHDRIAYLADIRLEGRAYMSQTLPGQRRAFSSALRTSVLLPFARGRTSGGQAWFPGLGYKLCLRAGTRHFRV